MLFGAMSCECFHCVDVRNVNGSAQLEEYMEGLAGTICPLCGTRTETFYLVTDADDMRAVRDGGGTWNKNAATTEGFSGFGTAAHAASGSSPAADKLRGGLSAEAQRRRKQMCQAVTDLQRAGLSLSVGVEAKKAGDTRKARHALEICVSTGEPESFRAAYHLGEMAERAGDLAEAIAWYCKAAGEPSDQDFKAAAFLALGMALRSQGDLRAAVRAFQDGADCGPTPIRGMAAFRVGDVLYELGDIEKSQEAYEFTVALRDPLGSPDAAVNLGAYEEEAGNWARARDLWEYAFNNGADKVRDFAAFNLGRYWDHERKRRRARKYYAIAERSGDAVIAARARAAMR